MSEDINELDVEFAKVFLKCKVITREYRYPNGAVIELAFCGCTENKHNDFNFFGEEGLISFRDPEDVVEVMGVLGEQGYHAMLRYDPARLQNHWTAAVHKNVSAGEIATGRCDHNNPSRAMVMAALEACHGEQEILQQKGKGK